MSALEAPIAHPETLAPEVQSALEGINLEHERAALNTFLGSQEFRHAFDKGEPAFHQSLHGGVRETGFVHGIAMGKMSVREIQTVTYEDGKKPVGKAGTDIQLGLGEGVSLVWYQPAEKLPEDISNLGQVPRIKGVSTSNRQTLPADVAEWLPESVTVYRNGEIAEVIAPTDEQTGEENAAFKVAIHEIAEAIPAAQAALANREETRLKMIKHDEDKLAQLEATRAQRFAGK